MSCEKRRNTHYYYRKVRQGKKVRSIYLGHGPEVEQAVQAAQAARQSERESLNALNDETRQLDALLSDIDELTTALMHAHLLAAGYHQHKGQWRKKREPRPKPE